MIQTGTVQQFAMPYAQLTTLADKAYGNYPLHDIFLKALGIKRSDNRVFPLAQRVFFLQLLIENTVVNANDDSYNNGRHQLLVASVASEMGNIFNLTKRETLLIRTFGLMHDLGNWTKKSVYKRLLIDSNNGLSRASVHKQEENSISICGQIGKALGFSDDELNIVERCIAEGGRIIKDVMVNGRIIKYSSFKRNKLPILAAIADGIGAMGFPEYLYQVITKIAMTRNAHFLPKEVELKDVDTFVRDSISLRFYDGFKEYIEKIEDYYEPLVENLMVTIDIRSLASVKNVSYKNILACFKQHMDSIDQLGTWQGAVEGKWSTDNLLGVLRDLKD